MNNESEHIISKSLNLFKSHGLKSVTMDDISNELSISKKTLYIHFKSKDALISETIEYIFERHFQNIDRILDKKLSALEKIVLIYRYGINRLIGYDITFYTELKRYHHNSYSCYEKYKKKIIFDIIRGLLEQAKQANEIRSDIDLTLFCELHFYNIDRILANPEFNTRFSISQLLNHLVVYNIRGILVHPTQFKISS